MHESRHAHTHTQYRGPLEQSGSCSILITCLFHVTAKVAAIDNGRATWYSRGSISRRTPLNQLLSLRLGCHSGSWNHICYLYGPLRQHPPAEKPQQLPLAWPLVTEMEWKRCHHCQSFPSRRSTYWGCSGKAKSLILLLKTRSTSCLLSLRHQTKDGWF